jgi:prolyl-tRNA synthetase
VDKQFHLRPGDRFFYHLQKGVPLRIELGEKDLASGTARVVRRDTGEKMDIPIENLPERMPLLLEEIHVALYEKALAFRREKTCAVSSYDEFKSAIEEKGGFVEAFFAGTPADEKKIKEETGATPRCMPLSADSCGAGETGPCMLTGKIARKVIFAKAY